MQKRGELSRLNVNLLIGFLILCLAIIIFIIVRGYVNEKDKYQVYTDEKIDLKISQIKKVDDNTLDLTLKRNTGEGDFIGLSFSVTDGNRVEVVRIDSSMPENQVGNFSLKFIELNASNIKKISVTPIYLDKEGEEVVGNVKDEYINPNVCSTYCPPNAQCGTNGCGAPCGNGCAKGYLCLDYKCVKDKSSSSGGSSGSGDGGDSCKDTCSSLVKQCGTHTICGKQTNCGTCQSPLICAPNGTCIRNCVPTTCQVLGRTCGTVSDGCGGTLTCGDCNTGYSCSASGTCMKDSTDCIPSTNCSSFGKNCGIISNGCSGSLNCGSCSSGYSCYNNVCIQTSKLSDVNIQQINSDCGDVLDYQCGIRTICDKNVDFGNCPSGYSCKNNLCIAKDNLSCTGVTCPPGEYCSHGVCLLSVTGKTYFIATWGNDNNPGTFEQPFYTWQKVVGKMRPGDIAYFRGGVWQPLTRLGSSGEFGVTIAGPGSYNTAVSGTAQNPIRYFNYPGERPILDGQNILPNEQGWSQGISLELIEHIHLRGLTIRHIHQSPPNFSRTHKPYSEVYGIGSAGANIHYENMVVHDIDGRGFQHWSYAWNEFDGENPLFKYDNTTWINCDAYNLFDRYFGEPGNSADGWKVQGYYGNYFTWIGCRAFNYSDDGFDPSGQPYRLFKNCWAMASDRYLRLGEWDIEGNGYKSTGADKEMVPNYEAGKEHFAIYENCLAVECSAGIGFYNNILVDYSGLFPNGGLLYNNLAYKNGIGYSDANASIHRNNIVYKSQQTEATGTKYELSVYNQWLDAKNNTYVTHPYSGDWWWKYNPAYTVTDADFVSLDTSQLMRPRKPDFSLPDITFGHLARGSDLIDGGVYIPGYHCLTAGAHPGQNCREWYGLAPDLGPFESNY